MTWGREREVSRRSHTPAQGQRTRCFLHLLPVGNRQLAKIETLTASGFTGLATVVNAAAGTYALVLGGTAFTLVAAATDTKRSIAVKLAKLINATATFRAFNIRQVGANFQFNLISTVTFTLANTGTTAPADLTVSAVSGAGTAIAKGATLINLGFATQNTICDGNWLQFVDPMGFEYIARVTTTAVAGDTSLIIAPLDKPIPAGSTCIYPPEFMDRQTAGIDEGYKWETFATFNTDGVEDGVNTGSSFKIKFEGIFDDFSVVYRTLSEAIRSGREFGGYLEYGLNIEGYKRPTEQFVVGFDSKALPLDVGGLIKSSFSGMLLGAPISTFSVLDE